MLFFFFFFHEARSRVDQLCSKREGLEGGPWWAGPGGQDASKLLSALSPFVWIHTNRCLHACSVLGQLAIQKMPHRHTHLMETIPQLRVSSDKMIFPPQPSECGDCKRRCYYCRFTWYWGQTQGKHGAT